MQHFEQLPTITFTPEDIALQPALVKNVFYTLDIIIQDQNYIELYVIEGTKRLDNISYELYESTDHWWILAKINSITDIIFDLPVDEELLQNVAMDRTLEIYATIDDVGAMTYYLEQFDLLVAENDDKRKINIIKPSYMGLVITQIVKSL